MKAMSKVLILATVTLMSASSFAADSVGQKDSKDCATETKLVKKKQSDGAAAKADEDKKPAKTDKAD